MPEIESFLKRMYKFSLEHDSYKKFVDLKSPYWEYEKEDRKIKSRPYPITSSYYKLEVIKEYHTLTGEVLKVGYNTWVRYNPKLFNHIDNHYLDIEDYRFIHPINRSNFRIVELVKV